MEHEAIAATQYGDYKGTAAVDGHNRLFLIELSRMADMEGHVPVGFSIYIHAPTTPRESVADRFSVSILGTKDCEWGDDLQEYMRQHGPVKVRRFKVNISMEDFFNLVKRFNVVVSLKGCEMRGADL